MALGAGRARIIDAVFSRALLQLTAGVVATGAALGIAFAQLFGANLTQGGAPAVIVGVATRRSLRIQPTGELREQ
jgi:hypothetical protein